jgi:hypothetical protein
MEGTRHEPIFNVPNLQSINKRDDRFFIETNHQHRGHLRKDRSSLLEGGRRTDTVRLSPSSNRSSATLRERPSERASASERYRRVTNDRTRTDPKRHVACRRARPSPVRRTTEATVKTDEDDGRSVRVARVVRASGDATDGRTDGRRDGRTDGRTPRRVGSGRWELL